jgi:hypothetical protein
MNELTAAQQIRIAALATATAILTEKGNLTLSAVQELTNKLAKFIETGTPQSEWSY